MICLSRCSLPGWSHLILEPCHLKAFSKPAAACRGARLSLAFPAHCRMRGVVASCSQTNTTTQRPARHCTQIRSDRLSTVTGPL